MIVGEFFDVHTTYFIKNSYRGTGLLCSRLKISVEIRCFSNGDSGIGPCTTSEINVVFWFSTASWSCDLDSIAGYSIEYAMPSKTLPTLVRKGRPSVDQWGPACSAVLLSTSLFSSKKRPKENLFDELKCTPFLRQLVSL